MLINCKTPVFTIKL